VWPLISYVVHQGDDGTVFLPDGHKAQYVKTEKVDYDGDEAVAFARGQAKANAKDEEAAKPFNECVKTREVHEIDWDGWERAKRANLVPEDVLKRVEKMNVSFSFRFWDLSNKECPSCSAKINKKDKFCRNCGCDLPKALAAAKAAAK